MPAERPFPEAEYRDRARRVREEMGRRGIDVLLVTSPPNLCYLSGFESIWYPPRAPVGCVLVAGSEELVFLDYERHKNHASTQALFDGFYMTAITLTTIGYGEVHPLSDRGRFFTVVLAYCGIFALFYFASELVRAAVTGELHDILGRQRVDEELDKLEGH